VAGGPPAAAAAGVMLKPHPTVVGNAKNGFAVYSCASPVYQPMTVPVNPAQCYPLTSQCRSAQVITPLPIGKRSSVISVSVCLCVCLYVRDHISGTTRPIFTNFFTHIPYGRRSVLFWRHSDALCNSGFMDDVTFAHKPTLLDVATQLKRSAHAALGLAINCAQ